MTSVNNIELVLDTNKAITLINFYKIFKDLIIDLNNCFKVLKLNLINIIHYITHIFVMYFTNNKNG